ncbi:hypothetical protein TWF481_011123 [Arthrobotrys musiformis]|uniref:Uncharacterized protein n=1 Tax=Arthrobotrys musiformis TaxID=47236 RepID=A0AAV9VZ83_9PEZI
MAIPPPPSFLPPPPPPPSFGRKRQRSGNSNIAASSEQAIDDEDANYIVYPSDDEQEVSLRDDSQFPAECLNEDDDEDVTETPRNRRHDSDGDFEMESEAEFSEDQEPQRKRAKAGGEGGFEGEEDDDDDNDDDDDPDANNSFATGNNKGKRRVSQKWREDVYRPTPGADSDDSDLNLAEVTPEKKRGKRKSVGKTAGGSSKKPAATSVPVNGLARNKSKSTPNLRTEDKPEPSKIRISRFYEGSMNDRLTRKGGVPPFVNFEPTGEPESGGPEYNSFGMRVSSNPVTMPPPPRPFPKSELPQSTPPPPKSKFTFFAPISNWFSKRWQKATQEYEERERKKDHELEVQKQVRILMERKTKAEKLYAENKLKGINQPRMLDQRIGQEPLVTEDQVLQLLDTPAEIGIAYTTDDVYAAPQMNESAMSIATVRAVSTLQGPTPRASTESTGSGGFVDIPRSSHAVLGGFHQYRDTGLRDGTPLTTDTTDIEGFRSRSRSPIPTPSKPLTKAELKKKERLEKKMLDLKKKLAETELDLSQVLGNEPLATSTPAPKSATIKKVPNADETIILIHEDGENREEEDEADKIVESIMGAPEPTAAIPARSRSMSPLKKLLNIGTKKNKDTGNPLHTVNESAKIKKSSPSTRGRGGGARGGGRGGKAVSKRRDESPDELTAV